jgi:hypothetical protein
MRHSRISLFYLAGYLLPTGLGLLLAPGLVFKLLFSTGNYGDVIPRLAGGLLLALGILVVQIIRYRLEVLLPSVVGVRGMLSAVLIGLFFYTRDPFFVIVLGVVMFGMIWTTIGIIRDRAPQGAPVR